MSLLYISISRITEVELPFKCVYNVSILLGFSIRDNAVNCDAYFLRIPKDIEYARLDSLCRIDKYWSKKIVDNIEVYSYSRLWGNEMEVPRGENEDDDVFLNISLHKGRRKIKIGYGHW